MAKDPYQYFRIEAREIIDTLGRGVLELERGGGGADLVVRLLRSAHTLKGAARIVKQPPIAKLAHDLEEVLSPFRDRPQAIEPPQLQLLFARVDELAALVAALDPPAPPRPDGRETTIEPVGSVRVALAEMDALVDDVFEVGVRLTALRRLVESIGQAPALGSALDDADREMAQLRQRADQLRLLPAESLFTPLERAVRDAAQALDRGVRFSATGGEQRLDASVLAVVRDALLHVVRNAVVHGIEPKDERLALGKPALGAIVVEVQRRAHRIAFRCRDDGRGIDRDAVGRAAVARGVIAPEAAAALGADGLARLILESGVTTAANVTELAGRGVGLDAVQASLAQLGGEIAIDSERGRGTSIVLSVPVALSSLAALVVEAAGTTASLPLEAVRRTVRVAAADLLRTAEHDAIVVDGERLPFLPLATALRRALPVGRRAEPWSAVLLEAGGARAAIGVDRLVGAVSVVVRPLPRLAAPPPGVLGASLDADGNPQLVLEPAALVRAAALGRGVIVELPAAVRPPVLVIDDSLTTRMLEKSILDSAGYEVDLATSAEEGLELARGRRYGLFIVDVEMPGMNGFQFLETVRGDAALGAIPAILVTSRSSNDDKRRGREVGARAYIVKGEFHQGRLLETIRELIG